MISLVTSKALWDTIGLFHENFIDPKVAILE